jgi:antitoxin VapB
MAVLIKDEEADRLIRTLAERTGETITEAVKTSVRERLARVPPSDADIQRRKERVREILTYFDALPTADDERTADEIIGYNEHGHFD